MKINRIFASLALVFSVGSVGALPAPQLIPEPQKMRVTDGWHRVTGSEAFDRSMVTSFKTDKAIAKEGYRLVVTPEAIEVTSSDDAGAFYAVETLKQLAEPRGTSRSSPRSRSRRTARTRSGLIPSSPAAARAAASSARAIPRR